MAGLLKRLKAAFSPPPPPRPSTVSPPQMRDMGLLMNGIIKAGYDSVYKSPENTRHWQWADFLSADASLHTAVRIELRSQSRYELNENNSYGRGLVESVVTDTIGTGPRLQVQEFSQNINQEVERAFHRWAVAVDLTNKLRVTRTAKLVDGETVARFINNINIDDPVQLDLQLIEADQLRSPRFELENAEFYVDGVHLDRFGNPYAYDLLRHHPGANYWTSVDYMAHDTYDYSQIVHLFKQTRPGQHRGVPEFAPALPLFAFLRRFTLATVAAAETAASVSQVIETDSPIPEELEEEYSATTFEKFLDTIPIDRNSATVLPNMWKLKQFAAEHPTTTYAMFKRELVSEIGRTLCIPANIATGDSANSNFASARFDWLGYERCVKAEQDFFDRRFLDRVFAEWLIEAALVEAIPRRAANFVLSQFDAWGRRGMASAFTHVWYWDGLRDADEKDSADAQRVRLQNGSTHRAREYALQGLDFEVEDDKAAASWGLTKEEYREWLRASVFTNGNLLTQEQQGEEPSDGVDSSQESQEEESEETEASATE